MPRNWTIEEDHYLIANYGSPKDASSIAKVIDRSEHAVKRRIKNLEDDALPSDEVYFFLSRAKRHMPKRTRRYKQDIQPLNSKANNKKRGNAYAHTKTGHRKGLDLVVRSGWEADILRVLKAYDIDFDYEPKVFEFPVKRGNKTYTPDIYLPGPEGGQWIEVKGWLDQASKVKLKRFKKHFPEEFENFTMIIGASNKSRDFCAELNVPFVLEFPKIKRYFKDRIKNWESR